MVSTPAPAVPAPATRRRSLRRRLLFVVLSGATALLQRLPDGPLHRLAQASGGLLYRAAGEQRRAVARANLAQICRYLAAHDLVEPDSPAALAARDERALERLLRAAFGHYVRTYLEVAIMPAYARADHTDRLVADDPALVAAAFGLGDDAARHDDTQAADDRPALVVAMHFGAVEMPALWGAQHGLRVTAPMETLADADLQTYLARGRGASGIHLVGQRGAARELTAALARGEVVALVADRRVGGAGARVELFGRTTRLPIGAAALAVESGAPAWLVTARRTGWGRYRGHLERIETPTEGSRRERMGAFLEAQARAFERAVALAPEQWWTLFLPIWDEPQQ
jgi:lauroyl/myristoyl acyltransferase